MGPNPSERGTLFGCSATGRFRNTMKYARWLALAALSCSGGDFSTSKSSSTGDDAGAGGARTSTGGSSSSGGATRTSTGGSSSSGGARTSTGGTTSNGGASADGGSVPGPTGGASSSGGTSSSGGATTVGAGGNPYGTTDSQACAATQGGFATNCDMASLLKKDAQHSSFCNAGNVCCKSDNVCGCVLFGGFCS